MSSYEKISRNAMIQLGALAIVVVVFGVLFSLQLYNLNSHRAHRFHETFLINQLNAELYRGLGTISDIQDAINRKEEALDQLKPYLNGKPVEDDAAFNRI